MAITICLSIITLRVNVLNAPIKDIGRLNGEENNTFIYVAYKRLTSDQKTYTVWK